MLIIRLASRTRLIACRELNAPRVVVDDWVVGCFWQGVPVRHPWIDTLNKNLKVRTKVITTFGWFILSHLPAVNQGPTYYQCFTTTKKIPTWKEMVSAVQQMNCTMRNY